MSCRVASLVSLVSAMLLGVGPAPPSPTLSARRSQCANFGFCHTEAKGILTTSLLRLPDIEIPPDTAGLSFFIPDKCDELGRELLGCVVQACDADAMPTLAVRNNGVGEAKVHRNGELTTSAYVSLKQYCSCDSPLI